MFSWSMNGSGFATSQSLWKVNQNRCNPPKNVTPFGTKVSFLFNDFETVGLTYIFFPFSMDQYDPNIKDINWGNCLIYHIFWQQDEVT